MAGALSVFRRRRFGGRRAFVLSSTDSSDSVDPGNESGTEQGLSRLKRPLDSLCFLGTPVAIGRRTVRAFGYSVGAVLFVAESGASARFRRVRIPGYRVRVCRRPLVASTVLSLPCSGAPARGRPGRNALGRFSVLCRGGRRRRTKRLRRESKLDPAVPGAGSRSFVDKAVVPGRHKFSSGGTTNPLFLCYICRMRRTARRGGQDSPHGVVVKT